MKDEAANLNADTIQELQLQVSGFEEKVEKIKKLSMWIKASAHNVKTSKVQLDRAESMMKKKAEDAASKNAKSNVASPGKSTEASEKSEKIVLAKLKFDSHKTLQLQTQEEVKKSSHTWCQPCLIDGGLLSTKAMEDKVMRLNLVVFNSSLASNEIFKTSGRCQLTLARQGPSYLFMAI